jgi:hypothetical protein
MSQGHQNLPNVSGARAGEFVSIQDCKVKILRQQATKICYRTVIVLSSR